MENLELVENKNGGYGIRDMETGRIVIPSMYKLEQLNLIIEMTEITKDVYKLKGINENQEVVYGIYNSYSNDFIDLDYTKIQYQDDEILLSNLDSQIIYHLDTSQDNVPVLTNIKLVCENQCYGIMNMSHQTIIPAQFSKPELMDVGDYVEVLPSLYILLDKKDRKKIVGLYDKENNKLIKGNFSSYDIVSNVLVLKNRVEINEKQQNKDILVSKSYLSLYDSKRAQYISDKKYYDYTFKRYESDGYFDSWYCNEEERLGLEEQNGVIMLNNIAYYDTYTGFFKENIDCRFQDNKIEMYEQNDCPSLSGAFLGYYTLDDRKELIYHLVCKYTDKDYLTEYLYVSPDSKNYVYDYGMVDDRHQRIFPVQEFFDFLYIPDIGVILDKQYHRLNAFNKDFQIKESCLEKNLSDDNSFSDKVYIINQEPYYFSLKREIHSLLSTIEHTKKNKMFPFIRCNKLDKLNAFFANYDSFREKYSGFQKKKK